MALDDGQEPGEKTKCAEKDPEIDDDDDLHDVRDKDLAVSVRDAMSR